MRWKTRYVECVNCDTPTPTTCVNCGNPLCGRCNDDLNGTDEAEGDGLCWSCREKVAGTYIGEEPEASAWQQELNGDYCNSRL